MNISRQYIKGYVDRDSKGSDNNMLRIFSDKRRHEYFIKNQKKTKWRGILIVTPKGTDIVVTVEKNSIYERICVFVILIFGKTKSFKICLKINQSSMKR